MTSIKATVYYMDIAGIMDTAGVQEASQSETEASGSEVKVRRWDRDFENVATSLELIVMRSFLSQRNWPKSPCLRCDKPVTVSQPVTLFQSLSIRIVIAPWATSRSEWPRPQWDWIYMAPASGDVLPSANTQRRVFPFWRMSAGMNLFSNSAAITLWRETDKQTDSRWKCHSCNSTHTDLHSAHWNFCQVCIWQHLTEIVHQLKCIVRSYPAMMTFLQRYVDCCSQS